MEGKANTPATALAPRFWDRLGIGLSLLCLAHCLVVPLVLIGFPAWFASGALHGWLVVLVAPAAALAAWPGYRRHRNRRVLLLLGAGVGLLVGGLLLHEVGGPAGEAIFTVAGSALLVAGHGLNGRLQHCQVTH